MLYCHLYYNSKYDHSSSEAYLENPIKEREDITNRKLYGELEVFILLFQCYGRAHVDIV